MLSDPERRISDADVAAIVTELRQQMTRQFYDDLGRGIWGAIKTLIIAAALALAALGYQISTKGPID